MKVYYHTDCLLHDPPYELLGRETTYLESPSRLTIIHKTLSEEPEIFELSDELDNKIDLKSYILRVHEPDYLSYLESAYDAWVSDGGDEAAIFPEAFPLISLLSKKPLGPSTLPPIARAGLYCFDLSSPITKDTFQSSLASLRVTLTAAAKLHTLAADEGVFALCRPPGHHAMPSLCGGYCFINNIAVAARFLQDTAPHHDTTKLAILDIDYHHGNGTQEIFYEDCSVLYTSLHGEHDYPYFTGFASETGNGGGEGFNANFPLPKGTTGNEEYCTTLTQVVTSIKEFNPVYLLISLGVDTHSEDPIYNFNITTEGYIRIGEIIASVQKPTFFVLEGGYHLETIGRNVRNVLYGFQRK
ncbi:hypothetical protein M0805_003269 [Coniferiporia weirii]|nr:hypothetical protein M0805_003269 [Coniferiporia weirii]